MIISLIIPMFNSSPFLNDLIDLLNLDDDNFEYIFIDDGSEDDTYEKCCLLCDGKANATVIHNSNHGVSFSRNNGIDICNGDYLMFVDSDDALFDDWWKSVYDEICLSGDADIVVFSKNAREAKPSKIRILEACVGIENDVFCTCLSSVCSKAYKRKFILNNHIKFNTDIIHGEDALFSIEAFLTTSNYYFSNRCIYKYRIHAFSSTHNYNSAFLTSNILYIQELEKLLLDSGNIDKDIVNKWVEHSFVNSIYIFAGKISKIYDKKMKSEAIKSFYNRKDYLLRLEKIHPDKSISLKKSFVYILIKHGKLHFLERIITAVRKPLLFFRNRMRDRVIEM